MRARQTMSRIIFLKVPITFWIVLLCANGSVAELITRPTDSEFLLIAHRGVFHLACENTVQGFRQSLEEGANALELDLSMTSDGVPVLWHDWDNDVTTKVRATGVCSIEWPSRSLNEVPFSTFLQEAGYKRDGVRIPPDTLEQFASTVAQDPRVKYIFIDLKVPSYLAHSHALRLVDAASTIFINSGVLGKVVFMTPYPSVYESVVPMLQKRQILLAFDQEIPQPTFPSAIPSAVDSNVSLASTYGMTVRFVTTGQVILAIPPDKFLEHVKSEVNRLTIQRPRAQYIVWTINNQTDWIPLVNAGVGGIMTDDVGNLCQVLAMWLGRSCKTADNATHPGPPANMRVQ